MKYINTFLFSCISFVALAQPTLNFDLQQSLGNEWILGNLASAHIDTFPLPTTGANHVWDYVFIGDKKNRAGVKISDAQPSDYQTAAFQSLEDSLILQEGGTIRDSFSNAVGIFFVGSPGTYRQGYLLEEHGGITSVGEIEDSFGKNSLWNKDTFDFYPFGLNFGDIIGKEKNSSFPTSFGMTSLFESDTTAYIGYGTLKMYYGEVQDVMLYQEKKKRVAHYFDFTGAFTFESTDYKVSYSFLQNGNLSPLLFYGYDAKEDWSPDENQIDVNFYVPQTTITVPKDNPAKVPVILTLSPNPAKDKVVVEYQLKVVALVSIKLLDANGGYVAKMAFGQRTADRHKEVFPLPSDLPTGSYYLQVQAGNFFDTGKVVVSK